MRYRAHCRRRAPLPLRSWCNIFLLNVRWYCRYALSYRDLEEMMRERGIEVDHSTINRWVLKYAPELFMARGWVLLQKLAFGQTIDLN